jgi:hypothetical protein
MLEVGVHQLCWLFLQALFIDASAPPTTMTASAINAAVFILSLREASPLVHRPQQRTAIRAR